MSGPLGGDFFLTHTVYTAPTTVSKYVSNSGYLYHRERSH